MLSEEQMLWGDIYPNSRIMLQDTSGDFVEAIVVPNSGMGDISDGSHTFNELYYHRCALFSLICNQNKDKAWKSKLHDSGTMFPGMFIVGVETPFGQCTYHYKLDHWDLFDVEELDKAPMWDGHTPDDVVDRLIKWGLRNNG